MQSPDKVEFQADKLFCMLACSRGTFGTLKEVWNNILIFTMGQSQRYTEDS